MFENLDVFKMSHAMAVHAGQKQALIAQNVANADTPGYVARDLPPFESLYRSDMADTQRATRTGHLNGAITNMTNLDPVASESASTPDGNTVSLEQQMLRATDTQRQHDRALAIYKSALKVLQSTLGGR